MGADRDEWFGPGQANHLVHDSAQSRDGVGRGHRHRHNHLCRSLFADRRDRGAHGGTGRHAVINQDRDLSGQTGTGACAKPELAAAGQFGPLRNGQIFDPSCIKPECRGQFAVQGKGSPLGAGHRREGKFRVSGHADLAHQNDVQRQIKRLGQFCRHRQAAARQAENHRLPPAVARQPFRQGNSRRPPVSIALGHGRSPRPRVATRGCRGLVYPFSTRPALIAVMDRARKR